MRLRRVVLNGALGFLLAYFLYAPGVAYGLFPGPSLVRSIFNGFFRVTGLPNMWHFYHDYLSLQLILRAEIASGNRVEQISEPSNEFLANPWRAELTPNAHNFGPLFTLPERERIGYLSRYLCRRFPDAQTVDFNLEVKGMREDNRNEHVEVHASTISTRLPSTGWRSVSCSRP